jgi:RNA polymerase sigma factor (sigma-70 family)
LDVEALFAAHHAPLFRYLVRLTGDVDLANDAAQEAFTRLVANPPRDQHPRAWLYTVATNVVRGWSNSRKRRLTLLQVGGARVPTGDAPMSPEWHAESSERRALVRAALDQLSERDRTVLLMREEGFSHREIAEVVGTTTGSVGTMIARALEKLASLLPLDPGDL